MKEKNIMEKKIDYIIEKEEKKYYPIIKESIEHSNMYKNDKVDSDRINEELTIIHKVRMSKLIYFLFTISSELKKRNELYMINGTLPNLYLLYVLGVTKFNPIEIGCCYESCIGTLENPKSQITIDIVISKRNEDKLDIIDFISNIEKDYNYINHHAYPVKSYQTLVLPKEIDCNEIFKTQIIDNSIQVVVNDEYTYSKLMLINVIESKRLCSVSYFLNKYGEVNIKDALEAYKNIFFDKALQEKEFIDTYSSFNIDNINDMLKLMAFSHSTRKVEDPSSYYFSDRESAFEYFNKTLGVSKEHSYYLMEGIRKGIFKSLIIDENIKNKIPTSILNDLNNIRYLFPRGHDAEHLYYDAINAYQYLKHKEEYIQINEIEYNDGK